MSQGGHPLQPKQHRLSSSSSSDHHLRSPSPLPIRRPFLRPEFHHIVRNTLPLFPSHLEPRSSHTCLPNTLVRFAVSLDSCSFKPRSKPWLGAHFRASPASSSTVLSCVAAARPPSAAANHPSLERRPRSSRTQVNPAPYRST
jgi:hypothetical protein